MSTTNINCVLLPRVLRGVVHNAIVDRHAFRTAFLRDMWAVAKRFGAVGIRDVPPHAVAGLGDLTVSAPLDETNRAALAGLCRLVDATSFFEFGTHRGLTAWTVAHNNPDLFVHTLDIPLNQGLEAVVLSVDAGEQSFSGDGSRRGEAFRDTPEAARIAPLYGDSATFDYGPYEAAIDVVYVDGGHSYACCRNDTDAARRMLKPGGMIVWDDYPGWPGVYAAVTELAPVLPGQMFHIVSTRLVVYSERDFLNRVGG